MIVSLYQTLLFLLIYIIMGLGVAKSISRCRIGFSKVGDRAFVTFFWPIAVTCMTLFGDWD